MEHQRGRKTFSGQPQARPQTSPFAPRPFPEPGKEPPGLAQEKMDDFWAKRTEGAVQSPPVTSIQPEQTVLASQASGALQRVISPIALEKKFDEIKQAKATYTGTLDDSTPADVANEVGAKWAGDDAKPQYYGASAWDSMASPTRQYRPPMLKKTGAMGGEFQANYEAKTGAEGGYNFNAHVTITGLTQEEWAKLKAEYKKPEKGKEPEKDPEAEDGDVGFSLFD
jgi:hypothetical protein